VEDASRGYRRVVPSPEPIEIMELEVIKDLVENGVLVIACGGGGVPVTWKNGRLEGVEAVIDKDRASALLAISLDVELFVISTDVEYVYLDYKKPSQRPIRQSTVSELRAYLNAGQFPSGSMGPKIESVLRFFSAGGKQAIITSCDNLRSSVAGLVGTQIFPDEEVTRVIAASQIEVAVGGH
jgi:carbamate kinase